MENNEMNQSSPEEAEIIIINPEVVEADRFTGEIVSLHVGYVFINHVKRAYETIGTNGDVFCPVAEDADFKTGQLVQFSELNPDEKRVGKFRTEAITQINTEIALSPSDERSIAIAQLTKVDSPYHQLKKVIAEEDIEKAGKNKPLAEFVQEIAWLLNQPGGYEPRQIIELAEKFVAKTFSMLAPLGVKCSVEGDVDLEAEEKMVEETITLYNENGLAGQAESLQKEYAQFLAVRKAFTLMNENGLLNYCSIIDYKHLPELSYAFPVSFVYSKKELTDFSNADDPIPDHAIQFLCDIVGSREYAWFYQVYNRRTRPLSQFRGKDIMPPALVRVMSKAKELFDYVVILSPYHDIASKEWSDPNWLRNIDPIMIGFLEGLPQMFILGRWSGTGVFPMLLDCIADTSNHLILNKHLLKNFAANSYWYKGMRKDNDMGDMLSSDSGSGNRDLERFADRLLLAYERGLLFPFLRGELSAEQDYKF